MILQINVFVARKKINHLKCEANHCAISLMTILTSKRADDDHHIFNTVHLALYLRKVLTKTVNGCLLPIPGTTSEQLRVALFTLAN